MQQHLLVFILECNNKRQLMLKPWHAQANSKSKRNTKAEGEAQTAKTKT